MKRLLLLCGFVAMATVAQAQSWSAPRTWVPSEIVTAALLNAHLRDNLLILKTSVNNDGTLKSGSDVIESGAVTSPTFLDWSNTGAALQVGLEGSVAATTATGTLAYGGLVNVSTADALHLATTDIVRMTIAAGGKVGVGVTAPGYPLTVLDTAGAQLALQYTTDPDGATFTAESDGDLAIRAWRTTGEVETEANVLLQSGGGSVGIGTASPATALDVNGILTVEDNGAHTFGEAGTGQNYVLVKNTGGNVYLGIDSSAAASFGFGNYAGVVESDSATGLAVAAINGAGTIRFYSAGTTEVGRWDLTSSLQIGGTAIRAGTAGTKRIDIFNGTAPTSTLANGISIYSASGEGYMMDAAGNATLQTPHDAITGEWIFRSTYTPTGRTLRIDMERLMRALNEHLGMDAIHEEDTR